MNSRPKLTLNKPAPTPPAPAKQLKPNHPAINRKPYNEGAPKLTREEAATYTQLGGRAWLKTILHAEQAKLDQALDNVWRGPLHCGHCGNDWPECVCTPEDLE